MVTQYINGVKVKLKNPFDFNFIKRYGRVFKVFERHSGNVCFGVEKNGKRYFLKFAGAEPANSYEPFNMEDTVSILKFTVAKYKELKHPLLINQIDAEEIGGGFLTVFNWFDGENCGYPQREMNIKFLSLPVSEKKRVFEGIMEFHAHVAQCGYVAIDFNDQSTLFNFENGDFAICDIDFYAKQCYMNGIGAAIGDPVIMSPEEKRVAGLVDEISNVYTMGATAFVLFAGDEHSNPVMEREAWTLNNDLYEVAMKAVCTQRSQRQQSIRQLIAEWNASK